MKFGEFMKELRLKKDFGLREFCKKFDLDPSNWSKLERGILTPPSDNDLLKKWATQLGLKKNDKDWFLFFDLASIARREIPSDILNDKNIVEMLPLFYRTLRGQKPTVKEMKNVAKLLKDS